MHTSGTTWETIARLVLKRPFATSNGGAPTTPRSDQARGVVPYGSCFDCVSPFAFSSIGFSFCGFLFHLVLWWFPLFLLFSSVCLFFLVFIFFLWFVVVSLLSLCFLFFLSFSSVLVVSYYGPFAVFLSFSADLWWFLWGPLFWLSFCLFSWFVVVSAVYLMCFLSFSFFFFFWGGWSQFSRDLERTQPRFGENSRELEISNFQPFFPNFH